MATDPMPGVEKDLTDAIRQNIETVANLEQEFIRSRSSADRIADTIANFSGSLTFIVLHLVVYALWILINTGVLPLVRPFDPFPFLLLSMSVSLEAIFLSTFVLIKQNRMSRRAEQRAHLDLQINLLAEREMTIVLNILQRISRRLGVPLADHKIEQLSEETSVEALVSELQQRMPDG